MNKWIRRGSIAAASLVLLAGAALLVATQMASRKMNRQIALTVSAVAPATGAAAIERGGYLYASRGCAECHGASGAGRVFVDNGQGLKLAGPHISPGAGSVTAAYRDEDWVRSIRHGVHPSGRPLMIMPSEDYNRFTDADLAALVGYIKQMPATGGGAAVIELPLPLRALYGLGVIQDAAAKIDHSLPPQQPVPEAVSVEHGRYVANMCLGCHGPTLAGGKVPGGPPDWPPAARLSPGEGSVMAARYANAEAFARMFKSGRRPDGSQIAVMPFDALSKMSDTDVRALHLYLKSLAK
jgi:mono/diheme cytochrome c family protein